MLSLPTCFFFFLVVTFEVMTFQALQTPELRAADGDESWWSDGLPVSRPRTRAPLVFPQTPLQSPSPQKADYCSDPITMITFGGGFEFLYTQSFNVHFFFVCVTYFVQCYEFTILLDETVGNLFLLLIVLHCDSVSQFSFILS